MNLQTSSSVGPAKWFQPLQVMIAAHTSVAQAAGISGEAWDLTAGKGRVEKAENDPLHLKGVMFLALSPSPPPRFLPSLLHMH